MNSPTPEDAPKASNALRTILLAGFIAGTLDIAAAAITTILRGGRPVRMLQFIAGGVLGRSSLDGGLKTASLGLLLHYVIAFTWTIIFYLASQRLTFLVQRPIISGLLYGIVVYLIMNLIVLPLSALHAKPTFSASSLIGVGILMFCIGLPIALIVGRYSKTT